MDLLSAAEKDVIYISSGSSNEKDRFHIALTGTANYVPYLGMVMQSAVRHNRNMEFVFHLFLNELLPLEKIRLMQFSQSTNANIYIHVMNDNAFKNIFFLNRPAVFFYRLVIPSLVKKYTDRIMYLDGDMMICGSLLLLKTLDFHGGVAAVVSDRAEERSRKQLGVKRYFNAGMMLINATQWEQDDVLGKIVDVSKKLVTCLDKHGKIKIWGNAEYHDQTLLNKLLDGQLVWLPKKYNYIYKLNRPALFHKQDYNEDYKKQVILHFASDVKPWHSWVEDWPVVKEYNELKEHSPWKDVPVSVPVTRKNYHRAAREYRITHQWGKAFQCYLAYYKRKLLARK